MQIALSAKDFLVTCAAIVALITGIVGYNSRGYRSTKEGYLVANREVGLIAGSFSIASAWIWAPALFVSAQMAYLNGWVGMFWYLPMNAGCLALAAFFMARIRALNEGGYTAPGYMRERFSKRVQVEYVVAQGTLAVCAFAVQLLAGAKVISFATGIDHFTATVGLAAAPIVYTMFGGARASVTSEFLKTLVICFVGGGIVAWAVWEGGGWATLSTGLYGKSGQYTHLFSGKGLDVMLNFGISAWIGWVAGAISDNAFYQRAYAIQKKKMPYAFLLATPIFAVICLGVMTLGLLAAGLGLNIDAKDVQMVNILTVSEVLRGWGPGIVIVFMVVLLLGLMSTLDSNLASIASLAGHDVFNLRGNIGETKAVRFATLSMPALLCAGIAIANVPGVQLVHLFLFYGTLRAATFLPTVIALIRKDGVSEAGMFWGILASLAIGLPLFSYGNLYNLWQWKVGGSILTILASGAIVLVMSWRENKAARI